MAILNRLRIQLATMQLPKLRPIYVCLFILIVIILRSNIIRKIRTNINGKPNIPVLNEAALKKLDYQPNETYIDVSDIGLRKIEPNTFRSYKYALFLYAQDNKLTVLDGSSFTGLTSLEGLDLSSNKISSFEIDWCKDLSSVTYLNLDNNNIKTLNSYTFRCLSNLRYIHMVGNNMTKIEPNAFFGLNSLLLLELSDNLLKTLTRTMFEPFQKTLESLFVKNNRLTELDKDLFVDMKALNEVYLSENAELIPMPYPFNLNGLEIQFYFQYDDALN